jgi:hypothetical protein
MQITDEQRNAFGVAFNEATLHGLELDEGRRIVAVTLEVLTLPEDGPAPSDSRVQVVLQPVGRIAASLREGADTGAQVVPFTAEELTGVVDSVAGVNVYGWNYIDTHERELAEWGERLSFDWRAGPGGLSHSLYLFQEGPPDLDVLVWFDELRVFDPSYREIPIAEFLDGGRRWWEAFRRHDPRTHGRGLASLRRSDA